jgi:methylated-DNA-protein-cysteine methyltransferase related protein
MSTIFARIYETIARIPAGRVATYGQVSLALGMPNGARTVGWAMRQCPEGLPWHRVVNAQGKSSLAPEGRALQRALLADEGVEMSPEGRVDLEQYRWQEL